MIAPAARGPCPRSRSRRPPAPASPRRRGTRRSSAPPSPQLHLHRLVRRPVAPCCGPTRPTASRRPRGARCVRGDAPPTERGPAEQHLVQVVRDVLLLTDACRGAPPHAAASPAADEIEPRAPSSAPVLSRCQEHPTPPDDVVELRDPEPGQQLRTLSATRRKKRTTSSGRPELLAQLRVLRGDAHRAGVEVALAQHHAALGDQRRGGHAELLGAEQRGDDHVAPVRSPPSTCRRTRSRSPFFTSTCCASASPAPRAGPRA